MNWTDFDIDRLGADLEHDGMSDSQIDEFFAHYGVPGMKWGVRKANNAKALRNERRSLSDSTKKTINYNANRYQRRLATGMLGVTAGQLAANAGVLLAGTAGLTLAAPLFIAGSAAGGVYVNRMMKAGAQNRYIKTKSSLADGGSK